ncbi:uncharacterized protein J3R85_001414 [Psidium guajava]|nr:uncharacterized protein J3R85_001414 [Psidium guajava]
MNGGEFLRVEAVAVAPLLRHRRFVALPACILPLLCCSSSAPFDADQTELIQGAATINTGLNSANVDLVAIDKPFAVVKVARHMLDEMPK